MIDGAIASNTRRGAEDRPRVAIFSPCLETLSGVSTHANMLLTSPLAKQFELCHFQVGSEGRDERAWQRILRLVTAPFRLASFLASNRIDMIHLNTSMDRKAYWRDLVFFTVAKLMRRRVLNQIHGGAMPTEFFAGNRLLTSLLRWFVARSDAVVVLSSQELRAYRLFAPGVVVQQIPNAIPVERFAAPVGRVNSRGSLRLVFVGRLIQEKGLREALCALADVLRDGHNMRFVIAGAGRNFDQLRNLAEELGVSRHVDFVGPVFGEAKAELWRASDVFVFPSYSEGLPYSLLEAMAAGCVPIVTPVGAVPDVVQDGVEALFVEPRQRGPVVAALKLLDENRDLLGRMSRAAVARAQARYSIEHVVHDFADLYGVALRA